MPGIITSSSIRSGCARVGDLERGRAVLRRQDAVTAAVQRAHQHLQVGGAVVDDEDRRWRQSRAAPCDSVATGPAPRRPATRPARAAPSKSNCAASARDPPAERRLAGVAGRQLLRQRLEIGDRADRRRLAQPRGERAARSGVARQLRLGRRVGLRRLGDELARRGASAARRTALRRAPASAGSRRSRRRAPPRACRRTRWPSPRSPGCRAVAASACSRRVASKPVEVGHLARP